MRRALQRQNRELSILNDVATVVNQGVEFGRRLGPDARVALEQLQFDAFMATRSEARDGFTDRCAARFAAKDVRGHRQTRGVRGPRQASVSEKSVVFPDLREANEEAVLIHPDIAQYFRLKLLVPIFHGERAMGTLQAYSRDPGTFDTRYDADLIAGVAISSSRRCTATDSISSRSARFVPASS